jgi:transcriptional regulator GlxA family with amidase domain
MAGDRVREMMLYSVRRPIYRTESGVEANSFFQTLGYVVAEALEDERPLNLPVSTDPVVTAATDHTRAHLDHVTVADVTRAVGVSERTLRRLFHTHLGMPWRSYLDPTPRIESRPSVQRHARTPNSAHRQLVTVAVTRGRSRPNQSG